MSLFSEDNSENYSNKVITSNDIRRNIALFEGARNVISAWWVTETKDSSTISQARRDYLRLNFPRANYLRRVVMGLAWSFPLPEIGAADSVPGPEEGEEGDGSTRKEQIDARVKELLERPTWEGNKNLWSALPWWRCFLFVTGSLFFKLPTRRKQGKETVLPERMPAENSKLMLSAERIKVIAGFEFKYKVESGLEDDPDGNHEVCERIYGPYEKMVDGNWTAVPPAWRIIKSPEYPEGHEFKEVQKLPFAPVSHLQWEERTSHPRGLPLFERLKEKALHLYSVCMDRREAAKFYGAKGFVRRNSKGAIPGNKAGGVWDIKDYDATMPAEVKVLEFSAEDTIVRNEYIDALRELYEEAFQPAPVDEGLAAGQPQSGKAMRQSAKGEVKYKLSYQQEEGKFLIDMITKTLTMEGFPVKPEELRADYDSGVEPDPDERRKDAEFYNTAGYEEEALRSMGKEEEEIIELMEEKKARQEEAMLSDNSLLKDEDELDEAGQPKKKAPAKGEPRTRAE